MSQDRKREGKTDVSRRNLVLNGIVVLLSAILFIQAVTFIREASGYMKMSETDEETLMRQLNGRQYDMLVENVYRNEARGAKAEGDMAQIYAAAYYYEAAMLYNAYQKAGNKEQAQEKYARMQTYEKQLGEYAFVKEEIWTFLGMDPENIK